MRAPATVTVVVAVSAMAVGCSGASTPAKRTAPTPSPSAAALAADVRASLEQRLIAGATFRGEHRSAATFQSSNAFISGDPDTAQAQALRTEGLRGAAVQHLKAPGIDDGLRVVLAFPDAPAAQADARRSVHAGPVGSTDRVFNVSGVPGAQGNELAGPAGDVGGVNVFFTVGSYEYIVGVSPTAGTSAAAIRSEVSAVAVAWYRRLASIT